jgi:hypothetical protein
MDSFIKDSNILFSIFLHYKTIAKINENKMLEIDALKERKKVNKNLKNA